MVQVRGIIRSIACWCGGVTGAFFVTKSAKQTLHTLTSISTIRGAVYRLPIIAMHLAAVYAGTVSSTTEVQ